jgi:hypothetical protein
VKLFENREVRPDNLATGYVTRNQKMAELVARKAQHRATKCGLLQGACYVFEASVFKGFGILCYIATRFYINL